MAEPRPRVAESGPLKAADLPTSVLRALELCQDRNARQPLVLDLRGLSDATDYFIVASGDSDVHVRAIADHVRDGLASSGLKPAGLEGERTARWVLIDYIDFVIHVFHPLLREFYQLERLWGDAPVMVLEEPPP